MSLIHPTAVIDPKAELDSSVKVGAYTVIGPNVRIGANTEIGPHAVINGHTTIGENNRIFQFASLGEIPQDKKYAGEATRLIIGNGNTIREFTTFNLGTVTGIGETRIGDDNWIMAYCHLAHDCVIGNHTVFANNASLAGHVTIGDYVILGGYTLVFQFCRIGDYAMTAFAAGVHKTYRRTLWLRATAPNRQASTVKACAATVLPPSKFLPLKMCIKPFITAAFRLKRPKRIFCSVPKPKPNWQCLKTSSPNLRAASSAETVDWNGKPSEKSFSDGLFIFSKA